MRPLSETGAVFSLFCFTLSQNPQNPQNTDKPHKYDIPESENTLSLILAESAKIPMKWIVQNQRARQTGRQLSKTELVQMAQAVEKQVAVEAKEKHDANGGDKVSAKARAESSNLNEPVEKIRTASKAAESIGVSENTYRDMKLVAEKGSEEQIERMNQGGRGNANPRQINENSLSLKLSRKNLHFRSFLLYQNAHFQSF